MSKPSLAILVVEDNPVNQLYLKTLLVRNGHSVQIANNGAEAIKEFARSLEREDRRFDLIFMDLQMPGTDGFHATARIREIETDRTPALKNIPICALSAYPLREETHREDLQYFNHYLTKPVTRQQIEAAIEQLATDPAASPAPGGKASTEDTDDVRIEEYIQALLEEFGGNRAELRKMLQMALNEIPQRLSELDSCFRERGRQQSCKAAHAMANVIGMLCAPAEREIALNLEKLFQAGDWQAARNAYLQLQERVQPLLQSYRLLLNRELG